jgi:hypothetical protein
MFLQGEELATRRNPIQPSRSKLSLRPRSRRCNHRMDLIEFIAVQLGDRVQRLVDAADEVNDELERLASLRG